MSSNNAVLSHTLVQRLLSDAGEILRRELAVSLTLRGDLSEMQCAALTHITAQTGGICRTLALLARYGEQLPPFDQHMHDLAELMQKANEDFRAWSTNIDSQDEEQLLHIQNVGYALAQLRTQLGMFARLYSKYRR